MEEASSSSAALKDAKDVDHAVKTENHELPLQYIVMAAGAAVILPLLYRLGPASSFLVVVFAVGISATPALRSVVDSILGKTAAGRHRLASQEVIPNLSQRPTLDSLTRNPIDAEAYIPLNVGDALQPPLSRLIDLVQRDFIDFWYTSSVALSSDTPFPQHTRSLVNATFNNLVTRVKRQDPKEVSIYLFHSASNALITQVRENKEGRMHDAGLDLQEKQNLIRKVRRTSEELMLTLAPRSACTSPLVLSLLVEVLSLQIWSTIQSLNSDLINTTIVSSFGQAVTAVKEVQKDAQEAEAKRQSKTSVESDGPDSDLESVLETTENGRTIPLDPVAELSRGNIDKVIAGNGALPPPLPVRKAPASTNAKEYIQDANARKPPQAISPDSPDHTFAASGVPSYGMMAPTPAAYGPSRKSLDAKAGESSSATTTSTSRPNSVPNSPRAIPARLEDRTIEEALDHGAAKLKAFGKGLFSAGQKLLDAAILPEDGTGPGHARQASEGGTHSRRGSIQLPQSPRAPSLKGKERALDLDDPADSATGSPIASSPSTSVKSPSMARDPSRKSVASFGSGFGSFISPPSSRPSSIFGGAAAPPAPASIAQLSARDKLQIAIDILKSKDADRCAHLAKQLERSLFSKDLALLFPAPQDDQLRAILARHTSVEELVDPTLIGLSDEFHAYLERDASGTGERLLRLWTQLDHFGYMVEMTRPTLDQLYDDTLGLLQKTINQMHDIPFATADAGAEERAYITACEMTMLRLQQNPNREIFEPLQDWLIKSIQEKYWDAFLKEKAGKEGIGMPRPVAMERVPSASTSKRTLDNIPNASSSAFADDGDLGVSMRDEDDARHSTTATNGDTSHAATAPAAPTGLTPSSSAASLPVADEVQIPAFSVTLTDLSPPSAYLNNHVKSRKDLEFLIAVEVEGSPGYILARKYIEFEKMDAGIKKALPQSGTKAFPRAPLPSTNFQTSDNLCRSLEHYLEALLHDDRYAASDPVTAFFAKERTDSKGGPVQPLAFLGRGVNNLGKGVADVTKGIGKGGEFAGKSLATGFNQFTSAVTTLPGLKRTTSSGHGDSSPALAEPGSKRFSTSSISLATNDEATLATPTKERLRSPSMASLSAPIAEMDEGQPKESTNKLATEGETVKSMGASVAPPPLPPRARSPEGYKVPELSEEPSRAAVTMTAAEPGILPPPTVAQEAVVPPPPGFSYTPRKKTGKSRPTSPTSQSIPLPDEPLPEAEPQPISPTIRGRMSFDELLQQDKEALRKQTEDSDGLKLPAPEAGSRTPSPLNLPSMLSPVEFNNVLSFAMAILEEAYDLVDSTWNLKRGLLKVLETVLRTSYAGVIKAAVQKLVMMASDEASYAKRIDGLTDSFWPPPERIWWSSLPGAKDKAEKTATEKEATRLEAKRLLLLQAPEGLKVTLGTAATADAFGRLHDALQGQGAERLVSSLVLDYLRLLLL